MIHEKIKGGVCAINSLAGEVPEKAWILLKNIRAELADAAEMAENLESRITVEQLFAHTGGQESVNG